MVEIHFYHGFPSFQLHYTPIFMEKLIGGDIYSKFFWEVIEAVKFIFSTDLNNMYLRMYAPFSLDDINDDGKVNPADA